ncbi:hypothetical protein AB9Q52_010990 [Pantoea vagans]|uniref:hypothetical protein n=1 Tax=Pantoea vagans TaxID=470934 RepID=UPI0035132C7E
MISNERLKELGDDNTICKVSWDERVEMARELLALRKAVKCQHQWETLKLVECGGSYQYCTMCGNKKVAAAPTPP